MLERSDDERVQVPRQDARSILDRLAPAELKLGCVQHDGMRAELGDGNLE